MIACLGTETPETNKNKDLMELPLHVQRAVYHFSRDMHMRHGPPFFNP